MSLSAWEQHVLDSIKDRLATSDPTLVARLAIFTQLASDEEMPAREKIQAGPVHTGRGSRRLGLRQTVPPLLWLVTTIALIVLGPHAGRTAGYIHAAGLRRGDAGPREVQAGSVHTGRRSRRPRWQQTVPPLLWLVTTIALIAVALVSNRGGSHGTCTSILGHVLHRQGIRSQLRPGIP